MKSNTINNEENKSPDDILISFMNSMENRFKKIIITPEADKINSILSPNSIENSKMKSFIMKDIISPTSTQFEKGNSLNNFKSEDKNNNSLIQNKNEGNYELFKKK